MNRPPTHPTRIQIHKLALNVLFVVTLAYVLRSLLTVLLTPGMTLDRLTGPQYWMAVASLLAALSALLAPERLRPIVGGLGVLGMGSLIVAGRVLTLGEMSPADQQIWTLPFLMLFYFAFGSRWGAAISGLSLLLPVVVMWLTKPISPEVVRMWVHSSFALGANIFIVHAGMVFMERHLMLHAEDHAKLRAARQDGVTDVYGRAAIEEELGRAMMHAGKDNTPVSIVVVDIDHFKLVNDRHGHATGDDVLRAVAKRLRRNVGGMGGMVGRWGGEEFLVLLPGIAKPDALVLAERLRFEIAEAPLAGLDITASFGVASYRGKGDTTDELFGRADMAMYEAKSAGRNAVR